MENYYYVKALEMTTKEINENKSLFNLNEKTLQVDHFKFSDMAKYAKKKKDLGFIKKDLVTIENILKSIKKVIILVSFSKIIGKKIWQQHQI